MTLLLRILIIYSLNLCSESTPDQISLKFYSTVLPSDHLIFQTAAHLAHPSVPLNYCSFFNNRAPSPQINLKNCTWYRENSCCLQSEIDSTFSKVKPLIGSSELCQKYLNYLMCYICAPNQFKFYGKERLTVCLEYCDKMYQACAEAILKGSKINEIYMNGQEFCESRRYNVDKTNKEDCFFIKIQSEALNSCLACTNSSLMFLVLFIFIDIFLVF
jgi:hypothetical protein